MLIDKSTWVTCKLADVTVKKEENDKENASTRFDKFIKVEHLDAESLHIKRWGNIGENELPPTFYKIFREGQVLYPTRNPHLKRVALASFDGICGEKTLTLEPIRELIDDRFYPFIFLAHSFFNHTTMSIIGSTNPHVRWRDVAEYKFLLPPKDQQVKFAELLWAADNVIERKLRLLLQIDKLYEILLDGLVMSGSKKTSFREMGTVIRGVGYKPHEMFDAYSEKCFVLLRSNNIYEMEINFDDIQYISNNKLKENQNLQENDICICMSNGSKELVGKAAPYKSSNFKRVSVGSFCAIFRPNKEYVDITKHLFNSNKYKKEIKVLLSGSNINNLKASDIEQISFSLSSKIEEEIKKADTAFARKEEIRKLISIEQLLQKQLINQIFS